MITKENLVKENFKIAQDAINVLLSLDKDKVEKLSDGYHTFDELYEFRKVYNATLFN